jgi:hypothetical protein
MMLLFLLFSLFFQDNVPFKPNEEFELKMDYQFKQRATSDQKVIDFSEQRTKSLGPLPYLVLDLRIIKINQGEDRIRVYGNKESPVVTKKLKEDVVLKLDLGFTDDMKDRVSAHEYTVLLLRDANKEPVSKIIIHVAEDGTFLVNGEKRGKL